MQFFKYCFLFQLFLFLHWNNVYANQKSQDNIKIAVVDVQSVLDHSLAVQSIRRAIEMITKGIQQEMSKKELELKHIEEDLVKKRGILNEEEFEKALYAFNKNVESAQKDVQTRKLRLEQAHSEAFEGVHNIMLTVINDLSKKYKIDLILPSSQVLFTSSKLNITTDVIKQLNSRVKIIKLNYKNP